ncbi:MAG: serine/threonine protein kinase [Anaerolineae bacterium]|nr:serine/threonine protein kinase [Anaerolineae bacterium]
MAAFDPLIGKQLGDYQIVEILGRGGMARVYKGYDARLDRYAAVKVIDGTLLATENEAEYRQRFEREARAIARLNHPNIVGIYQFGDYESLYYMAMVFIEGRDLGQILKSRNVSFTDAQILQIMRDTSAALDYAHINGVIHRDVKPSNIMVTGDHRAILTDFGLALSVPEGSIGNTFGSAHYIAPEQAISSADAVPQSDLYALGVVLYQLLAGKVPFDDPSAMSVALKHLNEIPPPISRFNPNISARVEVVVLRAIEKYPKDRFTNGAAFTAALEAAFAAEDEHPPMPINRPPWDAGARGSTIPLLDSNTAPPDPPPLRVGEGETGEAASSAKTRSRWWLVTILLVVLALAVALAVNGITASVSGESTATTAAVLSATMPPPTEIAAIIEEATEPPTAAPTDTLSPTASPPPPTPQPTEIPVTATAQPTLEPTIIPSTVPQLDGSVLLIYDDRSIVLLNQSDTMVNAGGLTFVQPGQNLSYGSNEWANGSEVIFSLPTGDCIQLWQINQPVLPEPSECSSRYAWRAVASRYWFWISPQENAVFEVWRDAALLATCVISAGACSFTP